MTTTPAPSGRTANTDDEVIRVSDLLEQILAFAMLAWIERRYVWRCLTVTVPLGLLVAFGSTAEYTASTKILPYRFTGASASGLSGLAGLAGIRLPAGASDPTITADLYPDVANTVDFRISVAETPLRFTTLAQPISTVRYFQDVSEGSVLDVVNNFTIGLPGKILQVIRPAPKPLVVPDSSGRSPLAYYSREYLKVVDGLRQRLTVNIDRKTAIITIVGTMPDAYAAADLVKVASERLMERIIDYESRKAGEQRRFVEEEQRRARDRFEQAQRQLATFTDRNRGTLSATAQIEAQRLQSEYNLAFELYRQFSTEREQSRIKQNQDTPVFTVLEQVVVPNSRSRPRRSMDLLVALLSGFCVGLGIIWWRHYRIRQRSAAA
ncbi:MAG: hypothetical protein ACYC3F_14070 [Gemmatimonadaceae bacterium]